MKHTFILLLLAIFPIAIQSNNLSLTNGEGWGAAPSGAPAGAPSFRNPILNMDVPDMALCHANGYYYMVSTTMHLMPGGPIMRSKDMKTWETV